MPSYDDDHCLSRYRALQKARPQWFENAADCPTRILLDGGEIADAQAAVRAERMAEGSPVDDLRVGVLAEDHFMGYLIRDAVRFADGRPGLYNRVAATGGIVVLPLIDDGIALIRIFRHAPRRWMLEAPQGFLAPGADSADETRRELMEEMGAPAREIIPLGLVYTSTALTSECLKVFAARIDSVGRPQRSEGIESIHRIGRSEIDRHVREGTICDGPTMTAILRARVHGVL